MKKNIAESYFNQKSWTIIDTIFLIAIVLFAIVGSFIPGGGPIGLPLAALSIIGLFIYRTTKVRDAEIDDLLNKIIEDNVDVKESNQVIKTFDLRECQIRKGKDGKVRSSRYVISCFSLNPTSTEINVYRIDLISGQVENTKYAIPKEESISLIEDKVDISGIKKTIQVIESKSFGLLLPVNTEDVNAYKIIEEICAKPNQ